MSENTDNREAFNKPAHMFSLTLALRVAAILSFCAGGLLFFRAADYASVAGNAAYVTGAFHLSMAVVIGLFLLLGEKVSRYLDGE